MPTLHRGIEQLVARRAHNPEVGGSSPSPATQADNCMKLSAFRLSALLEVGLLGLSGRICMVKLLGGGYLQADGACGCPYCKSYSNAVNWIHDSFKIHTFETA